MVKKKKKNSEGPHEQIFLAEEELVTVVQSLIFYLFLVFVSFEEWCPTTITKKWKSIFKFWSLGRDKKKDPKVKSSFG